MKPEQVLLIAAFGVTAYFLVKSKTVQAATTTYPGYAVTYPAGAPVLTPTGVPAAPATIPSTTSGVSTTGGGITYSSRNLAIEVGFDTIKNFGSGLYDALFGGEKPTITPANELTEKIYNASNYLV
jgi:hypothetical protein